MSKQAGFTPGPWSLKVDARNNAGACGANYKTHSREFLINGADGRPVISRRGLARPSKPDGAANARLIAAAPELYEALKEAEEQLSLLARDADTNWWVQKCRAALSKATPTGSDGNG